MKKHKLPRDWVIINSKSHPDRVYYFNVKTKKSTWKKPVDPESEVSCTEVSMARKRKRENNLDVGDSRSSTIKKVSQNDRHSIQKKQTIKKEVSLEKERETPQMLEIRKKMLASSKQRSKKQILYTNEKETPQMVEILKKTPDTSKDINKDEISRKSIDKSTCTIDSTPKNENTSKTKVMYGKLQQKNLRKITPKISDKVTTDPDEVFISNIEKKQEYRTCELTSHKKNDIEDKNNENICQTVEMSKIVNVGKKPWRDDSPPNKVKKLNGDDTLRLTEGGKVRSGSLRKNLAKERMEQLRRNLIVQSEDKSTTTTTNNNKSPHNCEKLLLGLLNNKVSSNIYKNIDLRHKHIRKRLLTNQTVLDTTAKTMPENSSEKIKEAPVYEDMDWEPVEDEEILFEVKTARTQLCVEEHANQTLHLSGNVLELPPLTNKEERKTLYVVIDTNIFLSNIQIVKELRDAKFQIYEQPILVIPWTVIRELDYLKSDKSELKAENVRANARKAVQFINEQFSSKHPRVVGQTMENVRSNKKKFTTDCPDDEILQVCLQIQNVGKAVALLSYDKNLCTKAMIHNILTIGRDDSLEKLDRLVNNNNNHNVYSQSSTNEKSRCSYVEEELRFTNEIFEDTKSNMKEFLSHIIGKEMKELYGDNWANYTIIKPPWNIKCALKCAVKHWLGAVSEAFHRSAEPVLKELFQIFSSIPEGDRQLSEVSYLLEKCSDLIQFTKVNKYHELMVKASDKINDLKERCDKFESEKSFQMWKDQVGVENNAIDEEQRALKVFKYLDAIYVYARDFCGMAAKAVGMPCSFFYESRNPPPSTEYLKKFQPEVAANVNRLLHALSTALEKLKTNTMDHKSLLAFYHTLMAFSPEELPESVCDLSPLDVQCCLKQKEDELRNGIHQLQELSTHLCRLAIYRCT